MTTSMPMTRSPLSLTEIRRVVHEIARQFGPRRVLLFGSYAYGHPTADSDVDLLVVLDTDEQPLHAAARISAAIPHPFPLDILVYTPSGLRASLERQGGFATMAVNMGVVLYEA